MALRRIVKEYTPNKSALDTLDEQTKVIQDLYDQVREFYDCLASPEFKSSLKGDKGDKGEQGERGLQGIPGAKGQDGLVGPQGPRGIQGEPGPRGSDGAPGVDGLPGERGPAGPVGPRGLTGPTGADGAKGEQGEKGDIGASFGLVDVQNTYADVVSESPRVNAGFYLVAGQNKENGDVYVYREKYDDFVFLNNIIYDLFFQLMQAPPGRNYLTLTKGEHCDEYGTIDISKEESIDTKGYLHTNFILNYLKGNGIKSTQWNEDLADSHRSTLVITFDNGTTATITVKNGKGITNVEKTGTNVLIDTYTITFSEGDPFTYNVANGKGIVKIEKTATNVLVDTYTITWNDNTTTTYQVTNGKGISNIQKTSTSGLTDTYTITYNDNTTTTYVVTNGKGIASISKTSTSGLVDTYTITYNDGEPTTFTVTNGRDGIDGRDGEDGVGIASITKTGTSGLVDTYTITFTNGNTTTFTVTNAPTPYEEAVAAGYDKSIETFYGIIEGNIWIGPGQNYADVYDNDDYKYENINVNNPLNIECIQDYIYVIYPADSEFMFNLTMSGFPIPMEPVDTTTIQDYYILKSVNQYDGNFNIVI